MTPQTITMIPADGILQKLDSISGDIADLKARMNHGEDAAPAVSPTWLPTRGLSVYFGISPRQIQRHIAAAGGKVRALRPRNHAGSACNTLYNVADLEAYLT